MNRLGDVTRRRALLALAAIILVGGFGVALVSDAGTITQESISSPYGPAFGGNSSNVVGTSGEGIPNTQVLGVQETTTTETLSSTSTVTMAPTTTTLGGNSPGSGSSGQVSSNGTSGAPNGLIEFSTDIQITSPTPQQAASAVSALAYSVGGYVAYQSTYSTSAYVVIRVPAADYQRVLAQVTALGAFVGETSNSNDVSVQYTDMNATLASLRTEQGALLKLLNQTATINSTLAVESQLQQVNQQINEVESQILQTKTLIDYATIDVTIGETPQKMPLSVTLSAIPTNGTSPLSVTFNAIARGGAQPYVINYNFGDGYATQGQIVIHTFYGAGEYKVVVSATDQNGTVAQTSAVVKVVAPQVAPSQSGIQGFLGYVAGLFLSVVEGIVEVAVVVLPLAAVGAAIVVPIQRCGARQRNIKQSQ